MKPLLIDISSVDLPDPDQLPTDPENCYIMITAEIGVRNEASDIFHFHVCTLKWLHGRVSEIDYIFGKNYIIVDKFDWDVVEAAIVHLCDDIDADTWDDVVKVLAGYGLWEYEAVHPRSSARSSV